MLMLAHANTIGAEIHAVSPLNYIQVTRSITPVTHTYVQFMVGGGQKSTADSGDGPFWSLATGGKQKVQPTSAMFTLTQRPDWKESPPKSKIRK